MQSIQINFNQWKPRLINFIAIYISNSCDRADLLQEISIKILEKSNSVNNIESIDSWIYSVSRNAIFNHLRQQAKHKTCSDYVGLPSAGEDIIPVNYNAELLECLPRYIDKIPEEYRLPLILSDIELLSQKEVATRLNISLTAAKSRIQRARRKLRKVLEEGCHMEFDVYGNLMTCIPRKKLSSKPASFS